MRVFTSSMRSTSTPTSSRPRATRAASVASTICGAALVLAACAEEDPVETSPDPGQQEILAWQTHEVSFPSGDLDLQGNLYLPERDNPVPGVVIVSGSGPHSRDGALPGQLGLMLPEPVESYRELAEALHAAGYAVLTWDKRTCGEFNDCAENDYPEPDTDLVFSDLTDDVGAALDFMAEHQDVGELFIVGHSKGGTYAADALSQRTDVSAAVLLAAPKEPINDVLHYQADKLEELLEAIDDDGAADQQQVQSIRDLADEVDEVAGGDREGSDIGGSSRAFWASWLDASDRAPDQIADADIPVLALGGEYDWQVPPQYVESWEQDLGEAGGVEILPNITHALTHLGTDDPAAVTEADIGTAVDPSVPSAITEWFDAAQD